MGGRSDKRLALRGLWAIKGLGGLGFDGLVHILFGGAMFQSFGFNRVLISDFEFEVTGFQDLVCFGFQGGGGCQWLKDLHREEYYKCVSQKLQQVPTTQCTSIYGHTASTP